jgi:hypothetical protein
MHYANSLYQNGMTLLDRSHSLHFTSACCLIQARLSAGDFICAEAQERPAQYNRIERPFAQLAARALIVEVQFFVGPDGQG